MINIKKLNIILAIIFSALYIVIECTDERYRLMWLLPIICAFILLLIDTVAGKKSKGIGYQIIKIVILIRYVITPISVVASQYYWGYGPEPSEQSMTLAIVLMAYELIVVGIIIAVYGKTHNTYYYNNCITKTQNERFSFLWVYIIISFIIIAIIDIRLIIPKGFIAITSKIEEISLDFEQSGLIGILRNTFRIVLGIAFLNLINKIKTTDRIKMFLSVLSLILTLSLYLSKGRWDTLCISLVGIILLRNLYPRYKQMITIALGSVMIISLASITIYKFFGLSLESINSFYLVIKEMIKEVSMQFQAYFSGPRNVALAIDMSKTIDIKWTWIFNDLLGSLPGFSQYFNQSIRFNLLYNDYIYSSNIVVQIIPLIGIGYSALGFFLSPIVTSSFIIIILKLNDLYYRQIYISSRYLTLYMIIYTSMCMGMNIQILTNKYYAVFIPSIILIFINQNFNKLFPKIAT